MTLEERFWQKVDRTGGPETCWLWLAGKKKYGNGIFKFNGKATQSRRVAYELKFGPIPAGLVIRASRDCNPACVNPAHLVALNRSEHGRLNGKSPRTTEELFWEKVDRTGGSEACWPWLAGKNKDGTGIFRFNGKATRSRCVAYELAYGPIPAGLEIRSLQDCKPTCVNSAHLRALTKSESSRLNGEHQPTHCKNGHPFTEENTHISNQGRRCRICQIEYLEKLVARPLEEQEAPADEPANSLPEREPVYPELWGDRQQVIGGQVVDEKFERRFRRKVDRTGGPEACWPWIGTRDPNGYGRFSIFNNKKGRKETQAHIVAYELAVG